MTHLQFCVTLLIVGAMNFVFGFLYGAQGERDRWTEWYETQAGRGRDLPRPPHGTITEDLDDDDSN